MKKDIVYTIRMNSEVRELLKVAAQKDRRSVASLLDKIIIDHLEREGFQMGMGRPEERRKHERMKITLPGTASLEGDAFSESFPGVILDLSLSGALVTYPKGSEIRIASLGELPSFRLSFQLPKTEEPLSFLCEARRMSDSGNEIHVGAAFNGAEGDSLNRLQAYLM
ncbi:MAG: PilZ domain-containing protein [Syntrophobacteraceae bacterium]